MQELEKAFDILDKFSFLGGQRAGRELWNDKSREVQDEDIANFNRDIEYLRDFIRKHMSDKDTDTPNNDGWIPVDERLPEEGETVLCTDGDYVYLVEYDADFDAPFGDIDNITGWQPSPEPYRPERSEGE